MNPEASNGAAGITCALISTDADFRRRLADLLPRLGTTRVVLELAEPFTKITDAHLDRLRQAGPDVVFVDLESDPQVGLKFIQFLLDSSLARSVVGSGSADSPELLLQIMQAGVQDFVPKPLEAEKVEGVLQRLRRKAGKPETNGAAPRVGEILSVFAPKGGTGATTLVVNLAVSIHQLTRKRTLIVDLDLELGETSLFLGVEPRFSSVDLVRNYHRVDEGLLASYIERHESGVDLLSAPYDPGNFQSVDGERIGRILGFLKHQYDYVVVDAPRALNPIVSQALAVSDRVLLVCTADLQSLRNATRSLPLLRQIGGERSDDWIRPVLNRHGASVPVTLAEVERTLGTKIYRTLRNDYGPLMTALNEGHPVVLGGRSAYADDVRALACDITGVESATRPRNRILGGLLSALGNGKNGKSGRHA